MAIQKALDNRAYFIGISLKEVFVVVITDNNSAMLDGIVENIIILIVRANANNALVNERF